MSEQLKQIQRQHVEMALKYIVKNGIRTNNKIYYLKRNTAVNPHRCTPLGWATKQKSTDKLIGMKETVRVAYLFSKGAKPTSAFSDKELGKFDALRPVWEKARKTLESLGFPCKDMRS